MEDFSKKRFYTRGTFSGIRISQLGKIQTLYGDWRDPWIKKRVNYLYGINCAPQNAELFVVLSFVFSYWSNILDLFDIN